MDRVHALRNGIAGFKLIFGVLESVIAVVWLATPHGAVEHAATSMIAVPLAVHHPQILATALLVLGLVKIAGAAGLITGTPWGWRIMVASVLALLPYDVYASPVIAPIDVAILVVLWRFRASLGAAPARA